MSEQNNKRSIGIRRSIFSQDETIDRLERFGQNWYDQLEYYNDLPDEYKQRIRNNPYYNQLKNLQQGFFEGTAKFQNRLGDLRQQFEDYNRLVYDEWYKEQYESPANQKQLKEQAGIYDIIGSDGSASGVGSGLPSELTNQGELTPNDFEQAFQSVQVGVSAVMSLYTGGLTGAMTFVSLKGAQIANEIASSDAAVRSMNVTQKALEVAKQIYGYNVNSDDISDGDKIIPSVKFDTGNEIADKALTAAYGTVSSSIQGDTQAKQVIQENTNQSVSLANSQGQLSALDDINGGMSEYFKRCHQMYLSNEKLKVLMDKWNYLANAETAQNQYDYFQRYKQIFGLSYGQFEADFDYESKKVQLDLNTCINQMRSGLYDLANWVFDNAQQGKVWAFGLASALGVATLQVPSNTVGGGIMQMMQSGQQPSTPPTINVYGKSK